MLNHALATDCNKQANNNQKQHLLNKLAVSIIVQLQNKILQCYLMFEDTMKNLAIIINNAV